MGEHLPCKQGVRGSNPLISTVRLQNLIRVYKYVSALTSKARFVATKSLITPIKSLIENKFPTVFWIEVALTNVSRSVP